MGNTERFDLSGHVAIVTGGGTGIGGGIATSLAAAGAAVVVAARRTDKLDAVVGEITAAGGLALAVATDVTDPDAVEALGRRTVDTFGPLSAWVNNAGGSPVRTPLTELAPDEWQRNLALNLTAVWQCSVVAARLLRDGGTIINISSLAGSRGVPGSGHYAAAKAGVESLTKTMALELAPRVRVNCIAPGWVPTEIAMTAMGFDDSDVAKLATRIPMRRVGTPQDFGDLATFLVSDAASWLTGQTIHLSGGS
jgi:NAD(P)-dependent dehydrogenase (short-subunit alcohol dehydrogenase family)